MNCVYMPAHIGETIVSWQEFLRVHAVDDLLMVERNARLYYSEEPIALHWLDRVSLLLIREAFLQKNSLAICYPVPTCNLPVLAAAQLLIYDLIRNRQSNLSILLISSRLEVRSQYLNLNISGESLVHAFPLAVVRASGEPVIVRREYFGQRPRLYHVSSPKLLDSSWPDNIDVVIVDHAGGKFEEAVIQIHEQAARQGVRTVIHLGSNPFAPYLERLREREVPVWIWDHLGLAADFGQQMASDTGITNHPFGVSPHQFKNIAAGIRQHLLVCHHPVFEKAAVRVWDDLSTVQRTFSGRVGLGIRRAIQSAYRTYYTMLHMLVPLPVYEEEARKSWGIRPISRRIADLEAFRSLLRDEAPDLVDIYWPSLILDLKEMYEALSAGNPKYDTLVQQIHAHLSRGKSLTIVCPNQATRRMLQLCLHAREGLRLNQLSGQVDNQSIRLITYKDLSALASCDRLVFPGQFSYGRRQYALTAAAPEIRYLAYGDEADRLEQQITAIHRDVSRMASAENRARAWALLAPSSSDDQLPKTVRRTPDIEFIRSEGERVSRRVASDGIVSDLSLWTPFSTPDYDLVRGQDVLSSDREEALRPSEFASPVRQNVLVSALRIEFVDGFCYAEPDSRITVFLPTTQKTDDRRADGLRPNDIVVFVDGDQRRHLYEAVLERLEHHPAMGATYILVRYWQQAIREGFFRAQMTYDEFLRELHRRGSQMVSTQGIRCWVTGDVLGPRDPEDILRVGWIFNDEVLIQEWKNISRALKRIRGLHISLARKLNRIIVQAGLMAQYLGADDECIDQELNLYLDDFRDSVSVHRVIAVDQDTMMVPYIFTGKFFEKETKLTW